MAGFGRVGRTNNGGLKFNGPSLVSFAFRHDKGILRDGPLTLEQP